MTHPMTDERLAELRDMASVALCDTDWFALYHDKYPDNEIGIECVRELLSRLDAAEELIREVANSGVSFDDERLKCVELQVGRDTLAQCRSYLR